MPPPGTGERDRVSDRLDDDNPKPSPSEGVRILGAEEAQAALESGAARPTPEVDAGAPPAAAPRPERAGAGDPAPAPGEPAVVFAPEPESSPAAPSGAPGVPGQRCDLVGVGDR